jgi:heptosyltransferase-2
VTSPLIIRLPNWVGDVCMALPTLRILAAHGIPLHLVGRGWAADLLAGHGWSVSTLPKPLLQARRHLKTLGPTRGLLLTNSLGSALAFRLAGIRSLGYANEGRSLLLHHAIPKGPAGHEVLTFWRLAQAIAPWYGEQLPDHPGHHLGLQLHADHHAQAEAALAAVPRPFVVLAPLAAGTIGGQSKKWPGFPLLARLLAAEGIALVGCPGPGEETEMAAAVPGATLLPGLRLGAYAAVLQRAAMTVANDSGPMHLAAATASPVIGLFGVSDPARTRPWPGIALGGPGAWPRVEDVAAEVLQTLNAAPPPAVNA